MRLLIVLLYFSWSGTLGSLMQGWTVIYCCLVTGSLPKEAVLGSIGLTFVYMGGRRIKEETRIAYDALVAIYYLFNFEKV